MRFEANTYEDWMELLSRVSDQPTAFCFRAGSYFKDGKLIYYIQNVRTVLR